MKKKITILPHKICIIGLGYVGLPLAIEFSKKYLTIGYDKDGDRISQLKDGHDKTLEVSNDTLKNSKLIYTNNSDSMDDCNIYIITVPTPVDKFNNPNMLPLESASEIVGKVLNKDDIVIYESTVYPGATEDFCVPILEKTSGLIFNKDFYCGYSPERINPGDDKHTLKTIMKVTSGSNRKALKIIDKLYKSIIDAGTHMVSSIAVAEAAKIIENIQRDVNIALINELSMIFNKLDLDTNEVLKAAGTKWNFLPFQPGLVGGHCIGVDPYYLTHKALEIGYNPEIILAGRRINDSMGKFIAQSTISEMNKVGINYDDAKIAILGLTFKENCPDLRNTKILSIISNLNKNKNDIYVTDPYADKNQSKKYYNIDLEKFEDIKNIDVIILAVAHDEYKLIKREQWEKIFNSKGVLIDVKSLYSKTFFENSKISHWRL